MNKTIMDAVNEFKGVWDYEEDNLIVCIKGYSMFDNGCIEGYSCDKYSDLNTAAWSALCSRNQFNALVKECETNFGKTLLTYDEYKERYARQPKVVKQPVFTQAMSDTGELPEVGMECAFVSTFFTNKTSNKGVCKIIAYYKDKVWCANREFECVINLSSITFKPIDTRTDKEKAVDKIVNSFSRCDHDIARLALNTAYREWVGK